MMLMPLPIPILLCRCQISLETKRSRMPVERTLEPTWKTKTAILFEENETVEIDSDISSNMGWIAVDILAAPTLLTSF